MADPTLTPEQQAMKQTGLDPSKGLTPLQTLDYNQSLANITGKQTSANTSPAPGSVPTVASKPTPVISPQPAADQLNGPIKTTLNNAQNSITTQSNNLQQTKQQIMDQQKALNTQYSSDPNWKPLALTGVMDDATKAGLQFKPTSTLSPSDQAAKDVASQLEPGNKYIYDNSGKQSQIPITQATPPGMFDQNPLPSTAPVSTIDTGTGSKVNQYADGTYILTDMNGNFLANSDATEYGNAQKAQTALDNLNLATSGQYPLSADQQAQIAGIKAQFQELIRQQGVTNANTAGVATIRENLFGMGNSASGQGEITGIINDGAQKIADLNTKMASAVASMTTGFQTDNLNMIKEAYAAYTGTQKDIQAALDKMATATQQAKTDARQALQDAYNEVQKPIDDALAELAKNGATQEMIDDIKKKAKTVADVYSMGAGHFTDPTSTAGQYTAYVARQKAAGKAPVSAEDFIAAQKYKDAYNSALATEQVKQQFTAVADQKSYTHMADQLNKTVAGRMSVLGGDQQKVEKARQLLQSASSYKDKNGNYNIPATQIADLAIGLGTLISGGNAPSDNVIKSVQQSTAKGDYAKAVGYITGTTPTGSSQDVIKNLINQINIQGTTAANNRNTDLKTLANSYAPEFSDPTVAAKAADSYINSLGGIDDINSKSPEQIATDAQSKVQTYYKTADPKTQKMIDEMMSTGKGYVATMQALGIK